MILKIGAVLVGLALTACPPAKRPEADLALKQEVLARLVDAVVVPTAAAFATEAQALADALAAWDVARRTTAATAERDAAKTAFRAAFLRWQRMELLAFGPAGAPPAFTHGLALRDSIYAWPTVNPCRVDTVLVEKRYEEAGFFDTALVTSVGLAVIEQLLYADDPGNACAATASINVDGTWAALSADELAQRRAAYAAAAGAAVALKGAALRDAWQGGARDKFAQAGTPSSGFTLAQDALNQVFAGMFAADTLLKDARLGTPSGVTPACAAASCPELAEARPSGLSREAAKANVEALEALLHGGFTGTGEGFDRLLAHKGAASLVDDLEQALAASTAALDAVPTPIHEAVTTNLPSVHAAHAAVKAFTDLLKGPFVTVLSLTVPAEGAGDND